MVAGNKYIGGRVTRLAAPQVLMAARRAMESITLDRGEMHLKDELSPRYAELVYNGFWFSPERLALQAAVDTTQQYVTGVVRVKLYKACCSDASVVGALRATLTSTSFLCAFVLISVIDAAGHLGGCCRRAIYANVWKACGHTQRSITSGIICIKLHELALLAPPCIHLSRMPLISWLAVFVAWGTHEGLSSGQHDLQNPRRVCTACFPEEDALCLAWSPAVHAARETAQLRVCRAM